MAWEKFTVLGCTHGNIIDKDAEGTAQRFVKQWKPKHRAHLGDIFEFTKLRKGASREEREEKILPDIQAAYQLLDWYKPSLLTFGNHDHRLWRAANESSTSPDLAEHLQNLAGEIEDNLRKRRIQWCHYNVHNFLKFPCGGPKLIHGYRSTMYPARSHFENWGECIAAHVHKPDSHDARHIDGGQAYTIGTLANLKKLTYADATPAKLGWRNSFGYGMINSKTGKWEMWHVVKRGGQWISPHGVI